jgi:DNA-binding NarL/FixJ family response regulator
MSRKERYISFQGFTRYEREILKLVADGYADELSMSERTVKETQVNLMRDGISIQYPRQSIVLLEVG